MGRRWKFAVTATAVAAAVGGGGGAPAHGSAESEGRAATGRVVEFLFQASNVPQGGLLRLQFDSGIGAGSLSVATNATSGAMQILDAGTGSLELGAASGAPLSADLRIRYSVLAQRITGQAIIPAGASVTVTNSETGEKVSIAENGPFTIPSGSAPGAALGTVECAGVSDCTTIRGPSVAVPASESSNSGNDVITATWGLECPSDAPIAAGSDWTTSTPFLLSLWLESRPDAPFYAAYDSVNFGAENHSNVARTFQPLLGCTGSPQTITAHRATAAAAPRRVYRVKTRRLHPRRTHRLSHGCRSGERLLASGHGVGFYKAKPSRAELRQVRTSRRHRRGRIRVRARTGPLVGDRERVEIQIRAVCRR